MGGPTGFTFHKNGGKIHILCLCTHLLALRVLKVERKRHRAEDTDGDVGRRGVDDLHHDHVVGVLRKEGRRSEARGGEAMGGVGREDDGRGGLSACAW